MTKDEILHMSAGREMDALIAVETMGWTELSEYYPNIMTDLFGTPPNETGSFQEIVPRYSTDISAAWDALEVVSRKYGCATTVGREYPFGRMVYAAALIGGSLRYEDPSLRLSALANTAPLAVCRLLLLATVGERQNP